MPRSFPLNAEPEAELVFVILDKRFLFSLRSTIVMNYVPLWPPRPQPAATKSNGSSCRVGGWPLNNNNNNKKRATEIRMGE